MTSADSPLPTRRLRVRRSAAITGAAFVAWLTVAPLSLSLLGISMWAWRSGVDVTTDGIVVRGMFTTREIPWNHIDGFATGDDGVQAILDDQSQIRLDPLKPENLPQVLEIGGQDLREDVPGEDER
jgi:hypothetical protein